MRKHSSLPAYYPSVVCSVALLCGAIFGVQGSHMDTRQISELLEKSITSLEKMSAFFGRDYSSVNVDGLFGIRVGEGGVNQTVTDCLDPQFRCPEGLVQRLQSLNNYIEDIAKHAMPYVESQDPAYFRHFRPTVDGPYILQYQSEFIKDIPERHGVRQQYDEEKGDMCLSSLMGQYHQGQPNCSIPNDCWKFMTEKNLHGYSLTHQLLYFIIGDKTGCIPIMEDRLRPMGEPSLRAHETEQCSRILADAKHLEHNGRVNILSQDLFLEQCVVCGILGYQNFMSEEWVRMALSWQNDQGCYDMVPSLDAVETEIVKLQGEERRLLSLMKQEAENIDRSAVTGRKLLREKKMEGDCLSHKTGLAFGLVGAYIRHFVRLLYAPEQHHH